MRSADDYSLSELSAIFGEIELQLLGHDDPQEVLPLLTQLAVERIPGAEYSGMTTGRKDHPFRTVAATHEVVERTDAIQYDLGSGPCVDAIVADRVYNAADLQNDTRWPEFGRRAVETTGVRSMLSLRLHVEDDRDLIAGLNAYSTTPNAFDEASETIGVLLATHGALAVSNASSRDQARNLARALESSRQIGIAMGILMALHKVTREQSFDLLRIASQHTQRKIAELAFEVAETGALPALPTRRPRTSE